MAMKSYFMEELHSMRAEIVNCKNNTKDPTFVDVKVSELQSKIGILEAENNCLKKVAQMNKNYAMLFLNIILLWSKKSRST